MAPAQPKRTLSEAHVDDDDAYCSASADSDEDRQARRRPRKRVKESTATNRTRRKTVDLKSIRIPVCYYSEKNNLFTTAWWKEVTQRDSFWEEFRAKVNQGTIRRRFNVSVNIGFDKIDPPPSVNQQKRVPSSEHGPSAVSTAAPKTPSRGIDEEASAVATCDDCGSALSAEQECEACRLLDQAMMDGSEDDREIKERKAKNIVISIPPREPQRRFSTPMSLGDPTEHTPSEAIPGARATHASDNGRELKPPTRSVTACAQSVVSAESDSNGLDVDDANTTEIDGHPSSTIKLRSGRKVVHDPSVIDDNFMSNDVKQDEALDAKVKLEPSNDEPELGIGNSTMLTDTKLVNQTSPDSVALKQQAKAEDIADAKGALASPAEIETKINGIKVEEDVTESLRRPIVDADWVQVHYGSANHIVASSQLTSSTYGDKPVFIFKIKGNLAIVPVADVTPVSELLPAQVEDEFKVKVEEGMDREQDV